MNMNVVQQAIINLFPDADKTRLNGETQLKDIILWDSMNAINLVMEIESLSGCSELPLKFSETVTISEIEEIVRSKGGKI